MSITLTSPTSAVAGEQKTLSWTTGGGFSSTVDVRLSLDNGATFPITLASNLSTTSYNWRVSWSHRASEAVIKVVDHANASVYGLTSAFEVSGALVVSDLVHELTNTEGTGDYTLEGASAGERSFADSFSTDDLIPCAIRAGEEYEVGVYRWTGSVLVRDVIDHSSNSGSPVNWGAGPKDVICSVTERYIEWVASSVAGDLSATDGAFSGNVSAATGRIGGLSGAAGGGEVFTVRTYEASGRAGLRLRGDGANNSNFGGMLFLKADGSESWHFALDTALTYGGGNDLGFRRWGQSVDTLKLGADGTSVLVSQSVAGANITVGFNTLQSFAYGGRNQLFYTGAIVGTQAFSMASVWGTLPSGADVWFELNQTSGMLFASNILTQWYDAAYIANVTNPDVSLRRLSAGTLEIAGANGAGAGHLSVKGTVRLGTYTDLTLPTAGAAGRIAYSSDSGLVYDDGTNWKKTTWSNV